MITNNIDLDVIEDDGKESAVELIMACVEKGVITGVVSVQSQENIEKLVLKIERFMQDLSDEETEISSFTLNKINESLKIILPILKSEEINRFNAGIIENYLTKLEKVSRTALSKNSIEDVKTLFKGLSIEELKENLKNQPISIKTYARVINRIVQTASDKVTLINYNNASAILAKVNDVNFGIHLVDFNKKDIETAWNIDLEISNKDDSKSIYSLWVLLEALKSIDGLEFEIEELSKGSIFAKIKVWFKSDEAKKEAEELLESTKKLAKGKLEKDYYENEKNKSESEKIEIEKKKLQNEIEITNSEDEKKRRLLEVEALEIENENKKLQNERLKLQLFLEKRQALSELLSDGIINSDEYKLAINDALQIHKKNDDTIEIGVLKENK